ncbi:MAG: ATP-binding cassette domain-containing protein [Christensenellaceae bacterium]|jgi:ribose transport system ATP-binding protein
MINEIVLMDNITCREGLHGLYAGNLRLGKGQIMAVAGLRNSGVTELVDVLTGKQQYDAGNVFINDRLVSPQELQSENRFGIANLHYSTRLSDNLTVAENILVMNSMKKRSIINERIINEMTERLLSLLNIELPPFMKAGELDIPMQHLIMLVRAIHENKKVLILENIHQNYTFKQMETLGKTIKKATHYGLSCIYKFYNTDPMFEYMDALTVLRNGATVGILHKAELQDTERIRLMMGDIYEQQYVQKGDLTKQEVLRVENISTRKNIDPVSFSAYEGETVMLINEEWDKAMEITGIISGMDRESYRSGNLYIEGRKEAIEASKRVVRSSIAYIPENAARNTIGLNMTVRDTILLTKVNVMKQKFRYLNDRLKNYLVREFFNSLDASEKEKGYTESTLMSELDEKSRYAIIFYKSLLLNPKLIIIANPFSFNDEVTRDYLTLKIIELNKRGITVLVVARDMYRFADHDTRAIKIV